MLALVRYQESAARPLYAPTSYFRCLSVCALHWHSHLFLGYSRAHGCRRFAPVLILLNLTATIIQLLPTHVNACTGRLPGDRRYKHGRPDIQPFLQHRARYLCGMFPGVFVTAQSLGDTAGSVFYPALPHLSQRLNSARLRPFLQAFCNHTRIRGILRRYLL